MSKHETDLKEDDDQIYSFRMLLWQLCGHQIKGKRGCEKETMDEAVVVTQGNGDSGLAWVIAMEMKRRSILTQDMLQS